MKPKSKIARSDSVSSPEDSFSLPFSGSLKDLSLPSVSLPYEHLEPDQALIRAKTHAFKPDTVAAALVNGCSALSVKLYLQAFPRTAVVSGLKALVEGHRIVTYAIERNSIECLQILLEYDLDPKAKDFGKIPVLAVAIMRAEWTFVNYTEIVKLLLTYGASPQSIPHDFWTEYVKTPSVMQPDGYKPKPKDRWCTPEYRAILARTCNLTMRYLLWRAARLDTPMKRMQQVAAAQKMTPLLMLPFQIIGQELAAKAVMEAVFAHVALNTAKPLVLAFAGLSGHGKTELAKQMGGLINAPLLDVDCTHAQREDELFGPHAPYNGHEAGSPLGNFLAEHSTRQSVVFLDEFDKTKTEIRNALLKIMDCGDYVNRKNNSAVDASRVIWILATNLGDEQITAFHSKHVAGRKDGDIKKVSIAALQDQLASVFVNNFSPAVTGRINLIAPFFPFSPNEQAVVAYKSLLSLQDEVHKPIDMTEPVRCYIGHAHINVVADGPVCQYIAKKGYKRDTGARSLQNEVNKQVRSRFVLEYCKTNVLVDQAFNDGPLHQYTVELHSIDESTEAITVFRDGVATGGQ